MKAVLARCGVGVLLLLLAVLVLLPAQAHAHTQPVYIPPNEHVEDDVATFAQPIRIEGQVTGDVTSVLGTISISGMVTGDVVSYGGSVLLAESARVEGHVLVLTGEVAHSPTSQVAGQMIGSIEAQPALSASMLDAATLNAAPAPHGLLLRGVWLLLLTALALLLTTASLTIWTGRTAAVRWTLLALPGRSLLAGLLTTLVLAGALLPLSAALAVTLVGLPVLLLLLLLLHVPYIYGLVALAQTLAQRLGRGFQPQMPLSTALVATVLLLLPVLVLGALLPLWGALLFYVYASVGLGALLVSRGGTLRTKGAA